MSLKVVQTIAEALDEIFPINIFLINENGIINWADKNMLKTSGISNLKTIEGQHASIFGDREWLTSKQVIESKEKKVLYEQFNDKDFFVVKVPYKKKGFEGVIGLSIDITRLKQAERAKSNFIMNMGHDIRTPFCGIITVLELLYAKENDTKKKNLIEISLYSCQRLLDFINDVQEIARLGYLPPDDERCDMKALLMEVVQFLTPSKEMKGLKIEVSHTGDSIIINRYYIEKILLNLLGNAVKFTEHGVITVSIKTSPILTIVVSDTGIGIDKKYHQQIFEEFFQVVFCYEKNEYAGIGKGLYFVKKYTEALHGNVTVQSALGKGSVFTVMIPIK